MKHLTIKARIALMCTVLAAVVAAFALAVLLYNEQRVMNGYFSDSLLSAAQLARNEIYYDEGSLEIDRNLDDLPVVRIAVYSADGDLIYGQQRFELPFAAEELRETRSTSGVQWVLQDSRLEFADGPDLWLRCYMPADSMQSMRGVRREVLLVLFPALILLAALGGWIIARRALRPLSAITRTAGSIADGTDLKKRIHPEGAQDEIYQTALIFDDMLNRLDESFERERRFTADAAHELRTPVTAIMAQSENALADTADERERAEALQVIYAESSRMSRLIQRLLVLARLDARQSLDSAEELELSLLLSAVAQSMEERAGDQGVQIHLQIDDEVLVHGDQTMLTQAVLNLAENAMNHGKSRVCIGLESKAGVCRIRVEDDGPGIAPEHHAHIFERFYRGDASRHSAGFGLGLSLVKRIAELHGGSVSLESASGQGCCFVLELPALKKDNEKEDDNG